MIGQTSTGWATTLADLAIILFLITAADLSNAQPAREAPAAGPIAVAEPTAIYRPQGSASSLKTWLAAQAMDSRQQLTITVHYRPGEAEAMTARGLRLVAEAEASGRHARMISEPADTSEAAAVLAYDDNAQAMARNLHR